MPSSSDHHIIDLSQLTTLLTDCHFATNGLLACLQRRKIQTNNSTAAKMKKGGKKVAKAVVTVEGLVEQGNNALSKLQPELAVKFFQRARAISPDDTNVLDALADVHFSSEIKRKLLSYY